MNFINGVKLGTPLPDTAGRMQLIDFWATWCAPRREAVPHLNALQGKYGAQGLTVIGITQGPRDTVLHWLTKLAESQITSLLQHK